MYNRQGSWSVRFCYSHTRTAVNNTQSILNVSLNLEDSFNVIYFNMASEIKNTAPLENAPASFKSKVWSSFGFPTFEDEKGIKQVTHHSILTIDTFFQLCDHTLSCIVQDQVF